MIDIIGEFGLNAGKVWNILNSCGSLTEDELIEKTGLGMEKIHIAVGWLARENKIFSDGRLFKLGETNLTSKVGENAGQLSKAIGTKKVDIFNISGLTHMLEKDIFTALGWLAREGKLNSKVEKETDELRSVNLEIESMKEELKSLNEDLETRNQIIKEMIIKEMTCQLSERQTQFVENIGIVERLQMELGQNESGIEKETDELRSVNLEIESMKEELKSLNEDLETRNQIIKEMK